jgi:hypothetical protein
MTRESTARLWNALLAVHVNLTRDLVDKLNHATEVTDDDIQPLLDAFRVLREEQFGLDDRVLNLGKKALENVRRNLLEFVDTTNRQIQARDSGDPQQQQTLSALMDEQYNRLVREFEQAVHELKPLAEQSIQEISRPTLQFPSLAYVGGAVTVDSPHSTNISSTIVDSPGAVANVAQYMTDVTTHVNQRLNESGANDDVKQLVSQLTARIAAIDPTVNPAKVRAMADDLKTLSDEVSKPEPRRKWYELSLDGIKEAAQTIGEIGKPVIETVLKLVPLLVP